MRKILLIVTASAASGCLGGHARPIAGQSGAGGAGGLGGVAEDPLLPITAGPMPLRRLNNLEFDKTVHDLLGDTTGPSKDFPSDQDASFLFRRAGFVSTLDAERLANAAEALAANAVRNLKALLPCDPAAMGDEACAREFVEAFGLRTYRRPVSTDEVDAVMSLYRKGRGTLALSFGDAIGLVIRAMLQSPQFLYHRELGPSAPTVEAGFVRLGPYEVASRLSYFLWSTMPDQALFDAAAGGMLQTRADIEREARRMLPGSRDTLIAFVDDWLELDLTDKLKDPRVYPQFTDALKSAMTTEADAFAPRVVLEGDGSFGTLMRSRRSFADPALAKVYGVTIAGRTAQEIALDPAQRSGVLTTAAFLARTGSPYGSHPTGRGQPIYERVLCGVFPIPPPDVQDVMRVQPGLTTRHYFEQVAMNPCANACHGRTDPLGFAFENYDGIGQWRTTDNGQPVDASGKVTLDGSDRPFRNAVDLIGLLADSADVNRCFATQWTRFALARMETEGDRANIDALVKAFARAGGNIRELLTKIATSNSFMYRTIAQGEALP